MLIPETPCDRFFDAALGRGRLQIALVMTEAIT